MEEKKKVILQEIYKTQKKIDLNALEDEMITFLYESIKVKKGYIFVYHESKFEQEYHFDINPNIVLSLQQFEKMQYLFVFDVKYKVIPLLLSDGYFYKKLVNSTSLYVSSPLLSKEEDIDTLISMCRKENVKNIWIMHPRGYSPLIELMKTKIPQEDEINMMSQELSFENENIHVVFLLMSKGMHYHELMQQIPSHISVSKILPLEENIKKWIETREEM